MLFSRMLLPVACYLLLLAVGFVLLAPLPTSHGSKPLIIGGICLLLALCIGFLAFPPPWNLLLATALLLPGGFLAFFLLQWKPRPPAAPTAPPRRYTLKLDDTSCDAPVTPSVWLGLRGETLTALRPCGIASFGRRRHDVCSANGHWIEAGRAIRVLEIRDNRIMVAPDEPDA